MQIHSLHTNHLPCGTNRAPCLYWLFTKIFHWKISKRKSLANPQNFFSLVVKQQPHTHNKFPHTFSLCDSPSLSNRACEIHVGFVRHSLNIRIKGLYFPDASYRRSISSQIKACRIIILRELRKIVTFIMAT